MDVTRQARFSDRTAVNEAQLRIEAATSVLAASRLDPDAVPLDLAADHAIRLNDLALRWLEIAA